jgi:hypothetical protein
MKSEYMGCRPGNRLRRSRAVAVTRHKHFGVDEALLQNSTVQAGFHPRS